MSQKYMTWQMETERSSREKKWTRIEIHIRHQMAKCFCFTCTEKQWTVSIWRIYFIGSLSLSCALIHFISFMYRVRIVFIQFACFPQMICACAPFLSHSLSCSILWAFHKECLWNFIFDSEYLDLLSFMSSFNHAIYTLETTRYKLSIGIVIL